MSEKKLMKFRGVEIDIAGEIYILPPLSPFAYAKANAGAKIKVIQDGIKEMQGAQDFGGLNPEVFMNLVELTWLALRRNYPDITEDEIGEGLSDGMVALGLLQYLISQDAEVQAKIKERVESEMAKNALGHSTKKES